MRISDFSILSCGVLLNALAQLGLKAATQITGPLVTANRNTLTLVLQLLILPSFLMALCAYVLSVAIWVVGLSRVPVSQAYPLLSLGYVLNIGFAWWLFGETPNVQRVLGVCIIIVGVVLVARSQ